MTRKHQMRVQTKERDAKKDNMYGYAQTQDAPRRARARLHCFHIFSHCRCCCREANVYVISLDQITVARMHTHLRDARDTLIFYSTAQVRFMLLDQYEAHRIHRHLRHDERKIKNSRTKKKSRRLWRAHTHINCKIGYYDHYNGGYGYEDSACMTQIDADTQKSHLALRCTRNFTHSNSSAMERDHHGDEMKNDKKHVRTDAQRTFSEMGRPMKTGENSRQFSIFSMWALMCMCRNSLRWLYDGGPLRFPRIHSIQ